MAITKSLGMSTGTFAPMMTGSIEDRSGVEHSGSRVLYKIDLRYRKINELEHVKWCRRNLGERHLDWDFWLAGGMLYIEVWGDKAKFTYEMWKN
jgi:hypothetical protein